MAVESTSFFLRIVGLATGLALTGCIGQTTFEELNAAEPIGSAFSAALFKNYSYLAKSFGTQSAPGGQAFDADSAISLTGADNTISGLANAYALKALAAGRGDDVLPEPAPDGDADAENVRLELLRDLDEGRDKAPDDSARAQADYDCWVMNRRVPSLTGASRTCRRSVTTSLAKLEHTLNPATQAPSAPPAPETPAAPTASATPAPSAPPAPAAPGPAAATAQQFTIEFGTGSAALSPAALSTIGDAIAAARSGRQSHIKVVGYTDTSENSQPLSLRRANVVETALVERGARPEAIIVSGVGAQDLAVQTEARVKEAKNRRAVITLEP